MTRLLQVAANTAGRDLIVGDIHGTFSKLAAALESVRFDPRCDRLFSVGDVVDRGPESAKYDWWLAQPWFFAVQGNHEDCAVRWPNGNMVFDSYNAHGGSWNIHQAPELQARAAQLLGSLPLAIELDTVFGPIGIVHADVPQGMSWHELRLALSSDFGASRAEQKRLQDCLQWSRRRYDTNDQSAVYGIRAVVVGHTPVDRPVWRGNVLHIDCRAWLAYPWADNGRPFVLINALTLAPEPCLPPPIERLGDLEAYVR